MPQCPLARIAPGQLPSYDPTVCIEQQQRQNKEKKRTPEQNKEERKACKKNVSSQGRFQQIPPAHRNKTRKKRKHASRTSLPKHIITPLPPSLPARSAKNIGFWVPLWYNHNDYNQEPIGSDLGFFSKRHTHSLSLSLSVFSSQTQLALAGTCNMETVSSA